MRILSSVFVMEMFDLRGKELKYANVSESLRKIRTKFYGVAGHVGRVKTVVTNLREMFRSRSLHTRQQNAIQHPG